MKKLYPHLWKWNFARNQWTLRLTLHTCISAHTLAKKFTLHTCISAHTLAKKPSIGKCVKLSFINPLGLSHVTLTNPLHSSIYCNRKQQSVRNFIFTSSCRLHIPKHLLILYCSARITSMNMLKKLHGLSPRANYTDRATAACRHSNCQLLRIEGATWSAWRIPTTVFSVL
jgi:hypothetical protein